METINELGVRQLLLQELEPAVLLAQVTQFITDPHLPWEEKVSYWHILFSVGQHRALLELIEKQLEAKQRVPFDLLINLTGDPNKPPPKSVIESLIKGIKKQRAQRDTLGSTRFDVFDSRFKQFRQELTENRIQEHKLFKENMIEKFLYLKNQRMTEQAARVLTRLIQLYPESSELQDHKLAFDEEWARNVLADHLANLQAHPVEAAVIPSAKDLEMLKCFLRSGETLAVKTRSLAYDLAIAFWFLEDFNRALSILAWAPTEIATDWMRAELLFADRRYIETLEQVNLLEVKYVDDPETTFSASYLRAQCLHALGQEAAGLEIMRSIVQVRSHYRSAHALILKWSEGASWE